VAFKDRLRRLQKVHEKEHAISILQEDGTVARFYKSDLADAFLASHRRAMGLDVEDHPLSQACRRSSDPAWRESVYTEGETVAEEVEDLSEPS
jgi:hypothetical protein